MDHIDHIVKLIGIGTDFDGGGGLDGCMDAAEVGSVSAELVKRGYSEEDRRKIWGANLIRVMRQAQEYAKQLSGVE